MNINEQREEVRRLVGEGKADREIAVGLGMTKNAVIGMRTRLGLKCNRIPFSMAADAVRRRERRKSRAKGEVKQKPVDKFVRFSPKPKLGSRIALDLAAALEMIPEAPRPPVDRSGFAPDWHPIMELNAHTCRWPSGSPGAEDFSYCLRWKPLERVYCDRHTEMARAVRGDGR